MIEVLLKLEACKTQEYLLTTAHFQIYSHHPSVHRRAKVVLKSSILLQNNLQILFIYGHTFSSQEMSNYSFDG